MHCHGTQNETNMTLEQIKNAVLSGNTVHWKTAAYTVIQDSIGQWLVVCPSTRGCWGLTWANGVTLNGEPGEFFVAHDVEECA